MNNKNIVIDRFFMTKELHHILSGWLDARLMQHCILDHLPKLGLIARCQNAPLAIAFLRTIEGGKAMIDGLLADPQSDFRVRDEAIDMLIRELLVLAQLSDITGVIAFSTNKRVISRAKKMGFKVMSHQLVSLELG